MTQLLEFSENYKGELAKLEAVIKQKFGNDLTRSFYLNRMCGIYLQNNKINKALVFAELNVKSFPVNANVWDTLGQVYYTKGNYTKALQYYQKALTLDPFLESSKEMLEKLKTK